ncbi:MAG: LysM domain-containing protein [Pyrinomonadaceae bacterium]
MKIFLHFFILLLALSITLHAQIQEVKNAEAQVNQLTNDAGRYFKEGLTAMKDNLRTEAGKKFNKSVEAFLYSTLNVQNNQKLSSCYNQLVETVYRIEFPSSQQPPQIRTLSAACGWNIDNQTADDVAKLVLTNPSTPTTGNSTTLISSVADNKTNPIETAMQVGFNESKFEASPLDDLSKLELTQEEQQVEASASFRVVKAQNGDTVASLAAREKASSVDIAKFNGLLPSSMLPAGREIKIPTKVSSIPKKQSVVNQPKTNISPVGVKPEQQADGKVAVVMSYYNETLNDPYSMRFVRWSKVEPKLYRGKMYWSVQVKFRSKNSFGAYVLSEEIYFLKDNKIIALQRLY